MIAQIVKVSHRETLVTVSINQKNIHTLLNSLYKPLSHKVLAYSEQKHPVNQDQYVYGILLDKNGDILIIASLFLQYKLSRSLSQMYHLQILYKKSSPSQQRFFHEQMAKLLPGYKILGLNVIQSSIFTPHEVYMQLKVPLPSKTTSKL